MNFRDGRLKNLESGVKALQTEFLSTEEPGRNSGCAVDGVRVQQSRNTTEVMKIERFGVQRNQLSV